MQENSFTYLSKLLSFGTLILSLKQGMCSSTIYQLVSENHNNSEDEPKHSPSSKNLIDNENPFNKNISIFQLYMENQTENFSENPFRYHINHSTPPPKPTSNKSRQNETYEKNNNETKSSSIKENTFNIVRNHTKRRVPVRRQESNVDAGDLTTDGAVSATQSSDLQNESVVSDANEPDESSEASNEDSSQNVEEETESDDKDESQTKNTQWPSHTWSELMVLFRKDVDPKAVGHEVGEKNVFQYISHALEHNRQAELELLKMKELLKRYVF